MSVVALTNHPTGEILKVTLDAGIKGSDNEDDAYYAHLDTKGIYSEHPQTPTDPLANLIAYHRRLWRAGAGPLPGCCAATDYTCGHSFSCPTPNSYTYCYSCADASSDIYPNRSKPLGV